MSGYDLLKAAHVTAVILWLGATLGALALLAAPSPPAAAANRLRALMSAGLVATWLAGLTLGMLGGWFRFEWLQAKLALVLALTAAHGIVSGRLRRAVAGVPLPSPAISVAAIVATLASVFVIAVLVLTKPTLWGAS